MLLLVVEVAIVSEVGVWWISVFALNKPYRQFFIKLDYFISFYNSKF